jgi:hypothetical protein
MPSIKMDIQSTLVLNEPNKSIKKMFLQEKIGIIEANLGV